MNAFLSADAAARAWLTAAHLPWLDTLMWTASLVGQGGGIWIAIALAAALARPALAPRLWQVLLAIVLCYLLVDGVLKPTIARARPFDAITDARVIGYRPVTYSFPSGHAASAFAGAFVVTLMLPRVRRWLWALATLVAISRVYIGVHYPLDITAGAIIGLSVGVLVTGGRGWYTRRSLAAPTGPQGP